MELPPPDGMPFWKRIGVGGLMLMIVPAALYFAAFAAFTRSGAKRRSPAVQSAEDMTLAFTFGAFAFSGVMIAANRRATLREAVVQWCVPPIYALVLSGVSIVSDFEGGIVTALLGLAIGIGATLNRFALWRGAEDVYWPKGWLGGSIYWGFIHIAMMMFPMFAFFCCFALRFA
jgi:hypothetical protein